MYLVNKMPVFEVPVRFYDLMTYQEPEKKIDSLKTQIKKKFKGGGNLPPPKNKKVILEDWKSEIARKICAPERKWDCATALSVAYAESGLNPDAVSSTNDHGIFQLHGKKIYDVDDNIAEAERMYLDRGWQPWAAYNSGKNKNFLNIQTASGSLLP